MLPNHCSHARPRINRPRNGRPVRLPAAVALLALVLLAAPHAARAQVQPQAAAPSIPSVASELKVMTWNIRGGEAIKSDGEPHTQGCRPNLEEDYLIGIAKEIRTHEGLDVVALQEVYRRQVDLLKPMLLPHLGSDPDIYFVTTRSCGLGPADDYGIAIISRYQFLKDSEESVPLCTMPFCPDKKETRVLARVIIRVDGRPIHIYNTHLPPRGDVHSRMANLIIRQVDRDNPDRAVLMGDFYMDDESAAYDVILDMFRDAWKGASDDEREACDNEGNTHPTLPKPTQREDYVFISKDGFRVDGARVTCTGDLRETFDLPRKGPARDGEGPIFKRIPDHLPLTVRLTLVE